MPETTLGVWIHSDQTGRSAQSWEEASGGMAGVVCRVGALCVWPLLCRRSGEATVAQGQDVCGKQSVPFKRTPLRPLKSKPVYIHGHIF